MQLYITGVCWKYSTYDIIVRSKYGLFVMYELPNHSLVVDLDQLQHHFHNQFKISRELEEPFSSTTQSLINPV